MEIIVRFRLRVQGLGCVRSMLEARKGQRVQGSGFRLADAFGAVVCKGLQGFGPPLSQSIYPIWPRDCI